MVIQLGPKRRNELAVMRDVLNVCMRSANKTRIVYSANLNFSRLNRYLHVLLSLGFLAEKTEVDGSIYYRTTPAGVYFAEGCTNIEKMREKDKSKRDKHGKRGVRAKLA
jgi:predicted transcriptional regulator